MKKLLLFVFFFNSVVQPLMHAMRPDVQNVEISTGDKKRKRKRKKVSGRRRRKKKSVKEIWDDPVVDDDFGKVRKPRIKTEKVHKKVGKRSKRIASPVDRVKVVEYLEPDEHVMFVDDTETVWPQGIKFQCRP